MSNAKAMPPVTHIPTQNCTVCGIPALGGYDRCLTHQRELDHYLERNQEWESGDRELDWLIEEVE